MTELKNCPLCGGECAVSDHHYLGTGASGMETPWPFVTCNKCGLRSVPVQCDDSPYGERTKAKSYKTAKAEAIAAWNARADGWQDIADAPRDELIIGHADGMTRLVLWEKGTWSQVGATIEVGWFEPTHFMPLPTPPGGDHG